MKICLSSSVQYAVSFGKKHLVGCGGNKSLYLEEASGTFEFETNLVHIGSSRVAKATK